MSTPFLSEIRIMSFNFAPQGWAQCNGQSLGINQNQALFSLLGTTYGGDGRVSFALPDLRGRVPVSFDSAHQLGMKLGEQAHTITVAEMPQHTHQAQGSPTTGSTSDPAAALLGADTVALPYAAVLSDLVTLNPATLAPTGGSQAHDNMQPYLALNFCIALQAYFPSP